MEQKTESYYLAAIKHFGFSLRDVPDDLRTPEMYLAAVEQDGDALEYVPESMKTPEMCMEAIRWNGEALEYVPDSLKTPEMCASAMRSTGGECEPYIPSDIIKAHPEVLRGEYYPSLADDFQMAPKREDFFETARDPLVRDEGWAI